MNKLLVRIGLSILGMVLTLAWWTYHDTGSHAQSVSHIPNKVLTGGNLVELSTEASTASTVRITFEDLHKQSGSQILMEAWEKIPAGAKTFTIDVPSGIGATIDVGADHPNVGDTLSARVKINGKEIEYQTDKLQTALEPNTAFFVQFSYDDFSKATSEAKPETPSAPAEPETSE